MLELSSIDGMHEARGVTASGNFIAKAVSPHRPQGCQPQSHLEQGELLGPPSNVSLGVDAWKNPSVLLADTPISQTRFDGAGDGRVSIGLGTYLDHTLRVGAKLGYEMAAENGNDRIFAKIDFSKAFGKLSVEGTDGKIHGSCDGAARKLHRAPIG